MIAINSKELKMLDKAAAEFAKKELAPGREEHDAFPFGPFQKALQKAFEVDFFHIILPEEFNGMGQGITELAVVLENLCREDSSLAGIIFTTAAAHQILLDAGDLNPLKSFSDTENVNDYLIAFPVFNNPGEIKTELTAEKNGANYLLNGNIDYLTLGGLASNCLVPARIKGQEGYSFFLAETKNNGVTASDPVLSLGLRACPSVDAVFSDARASLIGDEGNGDTFFSSASEKLNLAAAAMSAGVMRGSFNEAFNYAHGRFQGGQEIIKWSEMKLIMADMLITIEAADMMLSAIFQVYGKKNSGWETMAKAAALRIQSEACDLTTDGIQVMGGVGFMKDFGQEKRFRDAKQLQALLGIAPMKRIALIEKMIRI